MIRDKRLLDEKGYIEDRLDGCFCDDYGNALCHQCDIDLTRLRVLDVLVEEEE